jgi:hypothetical protein
MLIRMTVRGIALDPITNMPIIILKDVEESRFQSALSLFR